MNYQQIENAIRQNKPFTHNGTMRATMLDNEYWIYSYATPIYKKYLQTGEVWFNEQKYSRTTSRQQNIIRRAVV